MIGNCPRLPFLLFSPPPLLLFSSLSLPLFPLLSFFLSSFFGHKHGKFAVLADLFPSSCYTLAISFKTDDNIYMDCQSIIQCKNDGMYFQSSTHGALISESYACACRKSTARHSWAQTLPQSMRSSSHCPHPVHCARTHSDTQPAQLQCV